MQFRVRLAVRRRLVDVFEMGGGGGDGTVLVKKFALLFVHTCVTRYLC